MATPENLSITDFTIHKIIPKQDTVEKKPVFNSALKKTEPQKQVKAVQKSVKQVQTPVQKVEKQAVKKQKDTAKVTFSEIKEAKSDIEIIKVDTKTDVKTDKPGLKDIKTDENLVEYVKEVGLNKQNIVENLNKRLEREEKAAITGQKAGKMNLSSYDHYDYIVKPTISLGIVLLLILIFAWLYNKLRSINPSSLFSGKIDGMDINKFNVLATSSLGQGKVIHLVEINGKQLVIGSTNNNINILTEINPEDLENLQAKAEKKTSTKYKPRQEEPDEFEYAEPDSYQAKYTDLYKDYLDKE